MSAPIISSALVKRLATQIGISYTRNDECGHYPTVAQLQAFGNACVKDALERIQAERKDCGK